MKKIISAFLVLMLLSGLFVFPALAPEALEITSGNLSAGDTNGGICPVIVYTFSQASDEASLENITLKTGLEAYPELDTTYTVRRQTIYETGKAP